MGRGTEQLDYIYKVGCQWTLRTSCLLVFRVKITSMYQCTASFKTQSLGTELESSAITLPTYCQRYRFMHTLAAKLLSSIHLPDAVGSQSQCQAVPYIVGHIPPKYPVEHVERGPPTQPAQPLQMHPWCPVCCHTKVTLVRHLLCPYEQCIMTTKVLLPLIPTKWNTPKFRMLEPLDSTVGLVI